MAEDERSWGARLLNSRISASEAYALARRRMLEHERGLAAVIALLGLLQVALALYVAGDGERWLPWGEFWDVGSSQITLRSGATVAAKLDRETAFIVFVAMSGLACMVFRRRLLKEGYWTLLYLVAGSYTFIQCLHTRFVEELAAGEMIPKPYAFRILIPESIDFAGQFCSLADFNVALIYATNFAFLIAFLYTMRQLLRAFFDLKETYIQAFPIFVALFLVPFYRYWHHYVYDFPLLLLTALMLLAIQQERLKRFYLFFVLACFNKETAILMTVVFIVYQLHRKERLGTMLAHGATQIVLFAAIKLYIDHLTAANPGGPLEFHLFRNLGMLTLDQEMESVLAWTGLTALVFHRWSEKPFLLRCGMIPLAILLPIILIVGWFEELRAYLDALPFLLPLAWVSFCQGLEAIAPAPVREV